MSVEPRITTDIAIRCGFCPKGMRKWCRDNGYSLQDFIENGIAVSDIPEKYLGDELVQRMIRVANGEVDL